MGNNKSKKVQKEPDRFFEREKWKVHKREQKRQQNLVNGKRVGAKEPALPGIPPAPPKPMASLPAAVPAPAHTRSYDDEALARMRNQLHHDSEAFLLNNILLSVQFFENYEREAHHIKNNPISEREHLIDEAMVQRHKHVFFADRLQECIHEHVTFQRRRGQSEPLAAPRLYVIYDNVEASEPGDTSDYSAVLDAPFYKLLIEDCKEPGYVNLKKLEVLESTITREIETIKPSRVSSNDSVYTDSEKESNDSDDSPSSGKGEKLLQKIESKLINSHITDGYIKNKNLKLNSAQVDVSARRGSGPVKQASLQVQKSNIANLNAFVKNNNSILEDIEKKEPLNKEAKPRKSILKAPRRPSGPLKESKTASQMVDIKNSILENVISEDTETSGYRSTSSSRQNESSETESDYGYSTITELTTPKKLELTVTSNNFTISGTLPDECWSTVQVRADKWSDDEDDDELEAAKLSLSRNLYETFHYLDSINFMKNFVDQFIINLGLGLGLSEEGINNASTQGASIYCDTNKNGMKLGTEVFPALIAAWPNAANPWIIRERKIIQNPRTNFSYQWPTKYMVNKAIGFGCLLIPIGFRPKRGVNPEQVLQWKIIFPAAERYLESCLAHSHMRCYLFALTLQKTFLNNETSKIGIDASHIKNHLFWECEDNYAKWPEDRLGETLRIFLRSFYARFGQGRFPNYFMDSCNEFKSIPKTFLLRQQRQLANIIESPVLHLLSALEKLKYTKKDFYPKFNCIRLYDILTCKNPLRILNPNLPVVKQTLIESSDSEDDGNIWDKTRDKQYQWKKERQRQIQQRRKAQFNSRKQKPAAFKPEIEINTKLNLPVKMETERRRLVFEFFISHFIAMARSSERFDAIRQAVVYLEQAQRLCILLADEPGGDATANEFIDVIRDKLADCQRKLINQGGFKLPPRRESTQLDRTVKQPPIRIRPKYHQIMSQDSPTDATGVSAFTFVDVHTQNTKSQADLSGDDGEESKL